MKKGFSLVEVVLSLVIVAIAIVSLPTLVSTTQKSVELGLLQEISREGVAQVNQIISSPWDSNYIGEAVEARGKPLDGVPATDPGCAATLQAKKGDISELYKEVLRGANICGITVNTPIHRNGKAKPGNGLLGGDGIYQNIRRAVNYSGATKNNFTTASFGLNNNKNDIDDFNGISGNFVRQAAASTGDYLFDVKFVTDVDYIDDTGYDKNNLKRLNSQALGGVKNSHTDIKRVNVLATNSSDATNTSAINPNQNAMGDIVVKYTYYSANIGETEVSQKSFVKKRP